jgi:hypothetical protein
MKTLSFFYSVPKTEKTNPSLLQRIFLGKRPEEYTTSIWTRKYITLTDEEANLILNNEDIAMSIIVKASGLTEEQTKYVQLEEVLPATPYIPTSSTK